MYNSIFGCALMYEIEQHYNPAENKYYVSSGFSAKGDLPFCVRVTPAKGFRGSTCFMITAKGFRGSTCFKITAKHSMAVRVS